MSVVYQIDCDKVQRIAGAESGDEVEPYIEAARLVIDDLLAGCAASHWDAGRASTLGQWLAAHYYQLNNPTDAQMTSSSVQGSSDSFARAKAGEGFKATPAGRTLLTLDNSGCISNLEQKSKGRRGRVFYGGTEKGDQRRHTNTTETS